MKKRIFTLFLTTIIAFSLVACGGSNTGETEKENNSSANTEDNVDKAEVDGWDSMRVTVSGMELTLPCAYSNMPAGNSITITNRNVTPNKLNTYSYKWDDMMQETDISEVSLYNPTEENVDVVDAMIYGISVKFYSEQEMNAYSKYGLELADIVLPKGITFYSTEDEVLEAYGSPSEVHDPDTAGYDYGKKYTYQKDEKTLIVYFSSTAVGKPVVIGFEYNIATN